MLVELEDTACPNLAEDLPRLRGNYLGMLRLIDDQTKRLIEGFKAAGLYENTIFVVLSDHGDYCGEYGLIRKGAGVPECLPYSNDLGRMRYSSAKCSNGCTCFYC